MQGLCGLRVNHSERLPRMGPAILIANHNSHFDTPALFALFPADMAAGLHIVVALDYFHPGSLRGWIVSRFFGAITLDRVGRRRF